MTEIEKLADQWLEKAINSPVNKGKDHNTDVLYGLKTGFIEGYKAASSNTGDGFLALFKDEKNYIDFLKWQREQTEEVSTKNQK